MSLIDEYICSLDAQLDNIWLHSVERLHHGAVSPDSVTVDLRDDAAQHIDQLQETIRALSAASKSQPLVRLEKLLDLLSRLSPLRNEPLGDSEAHAAYVSDLCWLVAAKAVMQMLGSVMHIFLDRSLVLNEEIAYWADVQSSVWYTGLYTVQTSPAWLWAKLREECQEHGSGFERPISISLVSAQWERFYQRLRRCVQSRSMYDLRRGIPSFFSASKTEVRQKQKTLKAMKSRYTSSIGFLIQECLALWADGIPDSERLRKIVMKSTVMMDKIVLTTADSTPDFEEATFAAIEQETGSSRGQAHEDYSRTEPDAAIERLLDILRSRLPDSLTRSRTSIRIHGRPSHLTRYWIPLTFGFLTTNTFIKIWSSQRARLISWIMDIGSTTIQFWGNWVVEPVEKLVKTIRHDEGSEIALMSKNSLEADRASLERMVVDFVVDHDKSGGQATVATDVLASKVREGDLTPVLKAYERDLRTPFVGTVRGDLVRALLIQIQKTKVDVEVAMSGIDSLLKSQELVFGFVGLTPGILVSYAVFRWTLGVLGNRKGLRLGRRHDELKYALRTVHRTLTASQVSHGILSYHDHGLLLCDAEALLQKGRLTLSRADLGEFQKDVRALVEVKQGVERQLQVVERMRWGYGRRL